MVLQFGAFELPIHERYTLPESADHDVHCCPDVDVVTLNWIYCQLTSQTHGYHPVQ